MSDNRIHTIEGLNALRQSRGRLMGLDLGTKTMGIALSDPGWSVASPLETIARSKFTADAQALLSLTAQHDVAALIVGLPLNMDGSTGPRAQATKAFGRNLEVLTDLPIIFWDERLSTVAVERTLLEADTSRRKRAGVIDKLAAAYILQGALDRLSSMTE